MNCPTYDWSGGSSPIFYYQSIQLNISSSGFYTLESQSNLNSIDPFNATLNQISSSDDATGNS